VPEHLGDAFRDSAWHWKALERAVVTPSEAAITLPTVDLYAMEELTEFLSIYAVALLRAAGTQARAGGADQVSVATLTATHQLFGQNRQRFQTVSKNKAAAVEARRLGWESDATLARDALQQSFVEEFFTDVTERSHIAFGYEESDLISNARFPPPEAKLSSEGTVFITSDTARKISGSNPNSPVTEVGIAGGGVAVADVNGDGRLDIYLVSGKRDRLYRNLGDLRFKDITDESGLDNREQGRGAYFVDYDNDGDQDLFLSQVYAPNRLFRNRGDGTFEDVTEQAGLPLNTDVISHSATWFDFDNDGHLDVYVGNFGTVATGHSRMLPMRHDPEASGGHTPFLTSTPTTMDGRTSTWPMISERTNC
jgi:hypothetical protein